MTNFEMRGTRGIKAARNYEQLNTNFNFSCMECMRKHRWNDCETCSINAAYERKLKELEHHEYIAIRRDEG